VRATHDPFPITAFEDLHFAKTTTALAAANRNPSRHADLGRTENILIFATYERLVVPFNLNPKRH
jgi:hypothetical protein